MVKRIIFCLFSLSFSFSTPWAAPAHLQMTEEKMIEANLKSFPQMPEKQNKALEEEEKKKDFQKFMRDVLKKQLEPSAYEKRKTAFEIIKNNSADSTIYNADFLTYRDMEIFCGIKQNSQIYLANKIDRTETEVGRAVLYKELLMPKSLDEIKTQQKYIQLLSENDKLFEQLTKHLKIMAEAENALFSFWDDEHCSNYLQAEEITTPLMPSFLKDFFNNNTVGIEVRPLICWNTLWKTAFVYAGYIFNKEIPSLKGHMFAITAQAKICENISLSNFQKFNFFYNWSLKLLSLSATLPALSALKGNFHFRKFVQLVCLGKLQQISRYFSSVKALKNLLDTCPEEVQGVTSTLSNRLNAGEISNEVKSLTEIIKNETFKKGPAIFPFTGRIISACKKMEQGKDSLCSILEAIGKLDMYVSLARLIRESKNGPVKFCFPEFIDPAAVKTPVIELENFWHPMLEPQKAVPNSIILGENHPQTAVITGREMGGKSTITKAIVANVIMAQTLGIAPAEKMRFTPFAQILTSLNMVDDREGEESFFNHITKKLEEIGDVVSSLAPHEFSFFALDEVFNQTNYEAGQAAALSFIERLEGLGSNICVASTHFTKMTELADKNPEKFANYTTSVSQDVQERAAHAYKLQPRI